MKKYFIIAIISCAYSILCNVTVLTAQNISWERMKGPTGGWVLSIAAHPSDDIYAGTDLGGMYKSTDDGANWNLIGLYDKTVTAIAISSQGRIYAGTSDDGIYRSDDNGANWKRYNNGLTDLKINVIGIAKDRSIYAASDSTIYRSPDDGLHWIASNNGLNVSNITRIAFAPQGQIYIGTDSGLYRSTNNGMIWNRVDVNGIPGCSAYVIALGINANGDIFVRFPQYPMQTLAFRSTDGGLTWNNLGDAAGELFDIKFTSQGHIVAGSVHGVDLSTDNGGTWTHTFIYTGGVDCIALNSKGYIFGGTMRTGIYRSTDNGITFTSVNNGLNNMSIHSFLVYSGDTVFVGTKGNGLFYSFDNGGYWYSAAIPDFFPSFQDFAYSVIIKNSKGYLIVSNGKTFISTDIGSSWKSAGNNAFTLRLGPLDHLYNLGVNDFFVSSDYGASWIDFTCPGDYRYGLEVQKSGAIFITSSDGCIYKSPDEGKSWIKLVAVKNDYKILYISASDHIFAASDSIVIRSTDNGDHWTQIGMGLQNRKIKCLLSLSAKIILAGTENGVYYSSDNGNTFQSINDGLSHHTINMLALDAHRYVIVGTEGGGMFRSTTQIISIPPTPNIIYPLIGQKCVELIPTFKWNSLSDADTYRLQISDDSLFQGNILFDSTTSDTSLFIPSAFVHGKTYYCRMQSGNIIGMSAWNPGVRFTITPLVLAQTQLIYPPDGAAGIPYAVQFQWSDVDCADKYWFQTSTDSIFQSAMTINDSNVTASLINFILPAKRAKYYWRVSANAAGSTAGLWSQIYSFSTEGIMYLDDKNMNPEAPFNLYQSYPNPFSSVTTIHYSIPERDHVTLNIYDCLGREIAVLVDEEKDAGKYSAQFDIRTSRQSESSTTLALHQGVYFYRLTAGKNSQIKQMIRLK